jgi:hypothetical protein
MNNKIFSSITIAIFLTFLWAPQVWSQKPKAPLNSAPARAYYSFNSKIYYVRNIDEVFPLITRGQVLYIKLMSKENQDNKAKWYRTYYVYKPQITEEVDGVSDEGPIADLTGYAYKLYNGKWVKVDIFVRMLNQDSDWKFVSQRYQGEL